MAMNLFDDDDNGFDDFDDFGFDDSNNGANNGSDNLESLDSFDDSSFDDSSNDFDSSSGDFSNSDDLLSGDDTALGNDLDSQGGLKKTAVIMIIIGVIVVIGVFCLARVILKKDDVPQPQVTQSASTNAVTQPLVQQTTVNAQEIMGGNNTQSNAGSSDIAVGNTGSSIENYNDSYWISINGADQMVFSEPQEVEFRITDIKHYIAKAEGSDNYVVKSTLQGSLAGYSGTFHLDVPYEKGTLLQVGQQFTVYITVGTWNGKTVIGEINY